VLGGIRPVPGGCDESPGDVEQVGSREEAKLRIHPLRDAARDVLVPDLRRLHNMAIAVEHGEILAGHDRPPSSMACRTRMKRPPRDPRLPAKISQPARPINPMSSPAGHASVSRDLSPPGSYAVGAGRAPTKGGNQCRGAVIRRAR